MIDLLALLSMSDDKGPGDIWEYGLWGLRSSAKDADQRQRIMKAIKQLPDALIEEPEVSRACADFLEAAATSKPSPTNDPEIWALFDRTLEAVSGDPSNVQDPDDRDAVSHAINSSIGRLTEGFFALLFAGSLKVSSQIPKDLQPRLDRLLTPGAANHRPARVIASSRLSYLFAVDSAWTQKALIPSFDWNLNEEEATAAWQGYAWQPRIDEKLWSVLRPHFMGVFEPGRLNAIGDMAKTLVQLLMLVCIDLDPDQLSNAWSRNAIRAMTDQLRCDALSWIPDDEARRWRADFAAELERFGIDA